MLDCFNLWYLSFLNDTPQKLSFCNGTFPTHSLSWVICSICFHSGVDGLVGDPLGGFNLTLKYDHYKNDKIVAII
jgi:hypothetical protein